MSDTICGNCKKKAKWVVGNPEVNMWLCQKCSDAHDQTGELPEVPVIKKKTK